MIGFTNASSGVSYKEYLAKIDELTEVNTIVFKVGLDPEGNNYWICSGRDIDTSSSWLPESPEIKITVNETTFISKVGDISKSHVFIYSESKWYYNSQEVTLSEYGITLPAGGTNPEDGDLFTVTLYRRPPFTQTVALARMSYKYNPIVSYKYIESPTLSEQEYVFNYNFITEMTPLDHNMKATCKSNEPVVELSVEVKGI